MINRSLIFVILAILVILFFTCEPFRWLFVSLFVAIGLLWVYSRVRTAIFKWQFIRLMDKLAKQQKDPERRKEFEKLKELAKQTDFNKSDDE